MTRTDRRRFPILFAAITALALAGAALALLFSPAQAQEGDDAPVIASIEIVSDPGDDDTYQGTDTIEFKVSFNARVYNVGGRATQLKFVIGDEDRVAGFNYGSSRDYYFLYYVRWNDQDDDGISFKADALDLNGGELQRYDGLALDLSSDAVPDNPAHKVDSAITVILYGDQSPVVSENTYRLIEIRYSQDNLFYGQEDPTFGLTGVDSDDFVITEDGLLSFKITPDFENPTDSDGNNVYEFTVTASVPGLRDGSLDVTLTVTDELEPSDPGAPPIVRHVGITSYPENDQTYRLGDSISVRLRFSQSVAVTGTPQIELNVGGEARTANYSSTDGVDVTFTYVVAGGDRDSNGIGVIDDSLTLNGGSIRNPDGGADAVLTHYAIFNQPGQNVDASGGL